jgi:hypothetical protein
MQATDVEEVAQAQSLIIAENALSWNALTSNALTTNALTSNALTTNALTSNALTTNALTSQALRDPLARQLLKYIVGCALKADKHFDLNIDGVLYGFDGQIGLKPTWGDSGGSCDSACKTWVSGCVLSRVNYLGIPVPISIRGSKAELSSDTTERTAYSIREASYYGNIFASPQIRYACLSPGQTSIDRSCGPSLTDCVMTIVGTCDAACDAAKSDGSFPNCRDQGRTTSGKFPSGSTGYPGSVTVFLQ